MKSSVAQPNQLKISDFEDKSLLIVDDDDPLRGRLSRAMEKKGFSVKEAKTVAQSIEIVKKTPPRFAVIDLRLEDGNGLDVVKELHKANNDSRIVMLTGYGNLPTAVAVKAGAIDYIAKPVDADDVESALLAAPGRKPSPRKSMSADRVKWEHIHRVFDYATGTYQKPLEGLKCTEEHFREFYLNDLLDNQILNFINLQTIVSIIILKTSAGKNGYTPRIKTLSQPVKFDNQIAPNR